MREFNARVVEEYGHHCEGAKSVESRSIAIETTTMGGLSLHSESALRDLFDEIAGLVGIHGSSSFLGVPRRNPPLSGTAKGESLAAGGAGRTVL